MTTIDKALRPTLFTEYVGQKPLIERLRVVTTAAKTRGERAIPHVLLYGPGGLGKTTLAGVLANEMGSIAHVAMGPGIEKPIDLFNLLARLKEGDILFVDEIHRIPAPVSEYLYTAMEDGCIHIPVTMGERSQVVKIVLPPFTLVGATTLPEMLEAPMRMRFGSTLPLEFYQTSELSTILRSNAKKLGVVVHDDALLALSIRSRGTPRIANHLLRFARDLASIAGSPVTAAIAEQSLSMQGVDALGLDPVDRSYLRCLISTYGGGPVGAQALAATIGVTPGQVGGVIEPYLLMSGLIARTQRGRKSTPKAVQHMAAYDAANAPAELFAA